MGTWTLQGVSYTSSTHDTGELFGNHYIVDFKLRYTKSTFGSFKETPRLYWHEVIMMNDHKAGEHWEFTANMYEHNPLSKTLEVWAKHYLSAYQRPAGRVDALMKGKSVLVDERGQPVAIDKIGKNITGEKKQADAVREYLQKNGGGLDIQIDVIPSINIPKDNEHKERLLIFDCGVVGGGSRTKAIQYLDVDHAVAKSSWVRCFNLSRTLTGMKTTGLRVVTALVSVPAPRAPTFFDGECW